MPYFGPRKSTSTDHIVHTEKPLCSEKMEKLRLRRATADPMVVQNPGSSGRQSSIQRPVRPCRLYSRAGGSPSSFLIVVVTGVAPHGSGGVVPRRGRPPTTPPP